MCSPAGWGHGAEDRVLSSFRAAALSAHLRPQPHSRPAAGTTNNLWWAVVDFLAELQVPQIIVFRGGAFFAWPTLFRSSGSVWRPLFRRRGAAPRQNFACAAGKWGHLAQLCVSVRFAIVVEQELNPFVAILLTLLFFIVRYSSHTFSIYICFCESGSAPSAFALALSLEHSHR